MSHFTVAVPLKEISDLKEAMAPFEEDRAQYMNTFIRCSETMEELNETFKKEHYPDFETYLDGYHGYIRKGDEIGYYINENAKWDYYEIGGRWTNMLKSTEGGYCNFEIKKYIDLETPFQKRLAKEKILFDSYVKHIKGKFEYKTFQKFAEEGNKKGYHEQEIFQAIEKYSIRHDPEYFAFGDWELFKKKIFSLEIETYAFIDINGKWHGRGDMGWFGMSSNENSQWSVRWKELYDSVPEDYLIVIVDCHI